MDALAEVDNGGDSQALFRDHTGPLLEWLAASQHNWTVHSPELRQLHVLVTHAGERPPPKRAPDRVWATLPPDVQRSPRGPGAAD